MKPSSSLLYIQRSSFILLLWSGMAVAQLTDASLTDQNGNVDAPGGLISRSLQDQIGPGRGDDTVFGASLFLIARDPARSIRRGRQLFQRKFSVAEGLGPRVNDFSEGDITQARALGAGLSDSCAACHGRPRGSAGFGGDVVTRPDSRDAPHLFGLGIIEQLADEMTGQLRLLRTDVIAAAQQNQSSVTVDLTAKGVDFGRLTAEPDGSVDTSEVSGVDPDLRVRPFFHQGGTMSIREFVIGAFNDEMGLQAWDPVLCAATDPNNAQVMVSPSGFVFDPAEDSIERPKVCDAMTDGDGDLITNEIDPALVDHLEFYLLNYFKPGTYRSSGFTRFGKRLMRQIGCTSCHVEELVIESDRRVADVETVFDRQRGIFNDLFATASTQFEVVDDGQPFPLLVAEGNAFVVKNFFSDLKRHDLGPNFHERDFDGSRVTMFVTEPLWGVGSTAPYGHDGRSINLDAVIRRHGGEAAASSRAYRRLPRSGQLAITDFLQTLVLFPPDDTASNLNPGNPGSGDPQNPDNHGSINLGALFQTDDGAE